ncbi:MAG: hypothetical protein R3E01_06790 [Pirellulaceae bacterium]|nr:hypothetical protein [Planctomycetales bacterium]
MLSFVKKFRSAKFFSNVRKSGTTGLGSVESLENRELFAVGVIDTSVLGVGNNGAADQVIVATYGDQLQVTVNGINAYTDLISNIDELRITGSNDRDIVRFANLPDKAMKISVNTLGGNDSIITKGVGLPAQIFAGNTLRIHGGSGRDTLIVDDSGLQRGPNEKWVTDPTYAIDEKAIGRVIFKGVQPQLVGHELYYEGLEDLRLVTSHFDNRVYVEALDSGTTLRLHGGSKNDTFLIGYGPDPKGTYYGLDDVSTVIVQGGAGDDSVVVNDRYHNGLGKSYTVDQTGIRSGGAAITYASNHNLESVSLLTTDQPDVIRVGMTTGDVALSIDAGRGSDNVVFNNHSPESWFAGNITLDGGLDNDRIEIIDSLALVPQWYVIDEHEIGRYGETFSIPTATFERIDLRGGQAGSSFAVSGTRQGSVTTISGSSLDDYLYVYDDALTLDHVAGELFFEGNGGGDVVDVSDAGQLQDRAYVLAANQLRRSGSAPIHFEADVAVVATGAGNDTVIVDDGTLGQGAQTQLFLYAGEGSDTLDYSLHTQSISVDLFEGVGTGIASIRGIENVIGGSAADWLYGDSNNNILRGGDGDDVLDGRGGRDMLIGGNDADAIYGGEGEDLIVAGQLSFDVDRNEQAMMAIMDEWTRTDTAYGGRVRRLRGLATGGLNGLYTLDSSTLLGDKDKDHVDGEGDRDFFLAAADEVFARQTGEVRVAG